MKKLAWALLFSVFLPFLFNTFSSTSLAATSYFDIRLTNDSGSPPTGDTNVVIWDATVSQLVGIFTAYGGSGTVYRAGLDTSHSYNIGANKTTDSPYNPAYNSIQGTDEATGLVPGAFDVRTYRVDRDGTKLALNMNVYSSAVITATPTLTPIPCPYSSIEPYFRVKINDEWKDWKDPLNINQWQTGDVQVATFYNGTGNAVSLDKVQMVFNGTFLNSNPADVSDLIDGVGYYAVGATGIGSCGNLGTKTAALNVVYCPYEEVTVNSNRGRSGDPWLPDVTVNKKDVKAGAVQSGTYYNNGSGNQWSSLNNLAFDITKPGGEVLDFDANPKLYPVPPSWYTSGLYLNYPGTYNLQATATNNGVSCGDYPPKSQGTINIINCSYDTTVGGFQNVASPPPAWTANLYLPFTGATVKSAGFHDRSLSSIPPSVEDIKVFTPASQVILRITGPGSFDQRADQGAPFTYTIGGTYTLSVTTPNLDTADGDDIEDGIGCYASASLTLGGEPPPNVCVDTEERIPCCPFTLSGESLWDGLVNVLNDLAVWLAAENGVAPFKMGVSVDKIEFTADRTRQANLLFGQKKNDGTLEPGSVFKLSPPGEIAKCAIRTDDSDEAKIAKRETRVSWDVSLEGGSGPLKEGDLADVDPAACASDQIQGYLTRLPGVGVEGSAQSNQSLFAGNPPGSVSLKVEIGSRPPLNKPQIDSRSRGAPAGQTPGVDKLAPGRVLGETVTPTTLTSGASCQENLVRPVKQVECYESSAYGSEPNADINNLLLLLQGSDSLVARVSLIDVLSRSLVGAVSVCDTNGRGCTDQTISQNAGALDLFKIPSGKGYKNVAAEGKISPIRFTVEIGTPDSGIPFLMTFLYVFYGIPMTGSGTVPADKFSSDLEGCSVVYTGQGTFSDINSPKLSCVYIINDPELKARYWGSVQSAFYNTDLVSAEPGVQCKLDIPGGSVCSGQDNPDPIVTPPPGFTGSCTICNFNRGGPGRALEDLLDEVAGAVGTPASVLAGMLNFEGYVPGNPDPNKRHIFNYSDEEIEEISAPGTAMPYCAESYVGARGPCQFMPSQWDAYGATVNGYGYAHTPNICNLRDCLYASAAKMRNDAGILGQACGYNNETPPPAASCAWTNGNAAKSAYHYYGACTDNYVTTVVNYYYNYTCQTGGP